jgi:hypothetical protein
MLFYRADLKGNPVLYARTSLIVNVFSPCSGQFCLLPPWMVRGRARRIYKHILRFWNNDVLRNTDAVLEVIRRGTESTLP